MDLAQVTSSDRRILAARKSLQERCAALEDRVTDTVERAAGTVDHATSEIRGTVSDATNRVKSLFESTTENFQGALDLRTQMQQHPWAGVLLAVGAGIATRLLAHRSIPTEEQGTATSSPLTDIASVVRRELIGLSETVIATASKRLRENIESVAIPVRPEAIRSVSIATEPSNHRS